MATNATRINTGGSQTSTHETKALSDDGSRVFFSTEESLVLGDTNGKSDAYEFDVGTRVVRLLSSGTNPFDSWFMDASADGGNAFFVTRERLAGWDRDEAYDLYDARIGGGFPEPPIENKTICSDDACQGSQGNPPALLAPGSAAFDGGGNVSSKVVVRARRRAALKCKRGFVKKRVRGKTRCVRRHRASSRAKRAHAKGTRRGS
jgi:hypothetical protein